MFVFSQAHSPKTLAVLDQFLKKRHELATLLGFPSFADLSLSSNRMAKSTNSVKQFLADLSTQLFPKAEKEMDLLRHLKRKVEGVEKDGKVQIYGWDKIFYMSKSRTDKNLSEVRLLLK